MSWAETMVERTSWLKLVRRGAVLAHRWKPVRMKVLAATAEGVMMRRADRRDGNLSSSRWKSVYREWKLETPAREKKVNEVSAIGAPRSQEVGS